MKKRITLDERGYPSLEIRNRDGIFERMVDTTAVRKLDGEALRLAATGRIKTLVPGSNPYDSGTTSAPNKKLRQRSSLDYLRALSEEIKKKRRSE